MTTDTEVQRRTVWRWILAVVVMIAAIAALLVAAPVMFGEETTEEATTFDNDAITQIRTVTEAGHVEISVGDGTDIEVVTELTSSLGSEPRSEITLENGVLSIDGRCRSFLVNNCRVTYRITMPRDGTLALEVQAVAGTVDISGASGPVVVQTVAGNININDHTGGDAALRTTAGNVSFTAATPPTRLSLETTAGTIRVRVPDVGYRIDAQATVGNVSVDLVDEPNAEGVIEATTVTGSIDLGPA